MRSEYKTCNLWVAATNFLIDHSLTFNVNEKYFIEYLLCICMWCICIYMYNMYNIPLAIRIEDISLVYTNYCPYVSRMVLNICIICLYAICIHISIYIYHVVFTIYTYVHKVYCVCVYRIYDKNKCMYNIYPQAFSKNF